jgi:hypothetical protein
VGAHVAHCARCRFEAVELQEFLAEVHEPDPQVREVESSLRKLLASRKAPGPEARRSPWVSRLLPLAAGVLLAVSVLLLLRDRGPALPVPGEGPDVVRGAPAPRLMEPVGSIPSAPDHLSWAAAPGDEGPWKVRLETVAGELLWSTQATASPVRLPPEALELLELVDTGHRKPRAPSARGP